MLPFADLFRTRSGFARVVFSGGYMPPLLFSRFSCREHIIHLPFTARQSAGGAT